jgi:LysM repeat protein
LFAREWNLHLEHQVAVGGNGPQALVHQQLQIVHGLTQSGHGGGNVAAEEQGHLIGACGAIENLIYRPATEDLKDQLVRRLSELNTQRLFSGANTPWTATITVRPGDNLQRIANKNKTTTDALLRLNPRLKNPDKLTIGQSLRTLHYPDADLVVHKKLQCADLSLKKRLFKRFYVSVRDTVEPGAYPVEAEPGARAIDRLKTIFKLLTPADRQELRLFLAPGSRITVTAQ